MSYREFYLHIKETCPNIHVETSGEWNMFFANGELVAAYNDYTGETVELEKEAV